MEKTTEEEGLSTTASRKEEEAQSVAEGKGGVDDEEKNLNRRPKKKRKHQSNDNKKNDDAYIQAYQGFRFESIPSTGRPGTPHRYFAESYRVFRVDDDENDADDAAACNNTPTPMFLRVHKHVNGLAVVCVERTGDDNEDEEAVSVEFLVKEAPAQSQGEKRKRQSRMLKGKKRVEHTVHPIDDLVVWKPKNSAVVAVSGKSQTRGQVQKEEKGGKDLQHRSLSRSCAVWGSVLELNKRVVDDPSLLRRDPLLDGYLAIILPTGPFPPPENVINTNTATT